MTEANRRSQYDSGMKKEGMRQEEAAEVKATRGKAAGRIGVDNKEAGRTDDVLIGEKEMDNMVPTDTTAGQNMTDGKRQNSYSEVVIDGIKRNARVVVGDSLVTKSDKE